MTKSNAKPGPEGDHHLERLIFFSDAVFAIAITLLVIEIHPPHLENGQWQDGVNALIALIPSFFGFALSFLVIGRFWIGHHATLGRVAAFHSKLLWPNLLLLMAIAFMPFATTFMTTNIGQLVPTAFYNLTLMVTALLSWRVVRMACALWPDSEDPELRWTMQSRGLGVALGAALAFVVTFVSPLFSQVALISIPFWQWLLRRRRKTTE